MHFPKILQKAWRDSAIRAVALILLPCAFANAGKIEPGHSAMWINPDHDGVDGEGWVLEILSNDRAALYWYTSDDEGKPRWIISNGAGSIVPGEDGDKIVFPELVTGHGGRFAQDVPASDVTLEVVGTAEMRFSDCNTGEISFDAYGKTATYPLTRLSRTMGAVCSPVGSPVQPYAGTSGTWFESEHNGGPVFTLQWLENGAAILFWFAYDPEGHPFWAAGLGTYENELLTFPQMDYVSGGRFGEHDPSAPAVLVPWGSLEMHFTCDDATVSYNATAEGFGFGMFNLKPLTKLAKPACPYVKAKLTDLYDIELIELPEEPATPGTETQMGSGNLILYGSVANNGTVAALRKILDREYIWNYPVRLTLESMTWENILDMSASSRVAGWPIISADGDSILINQLSPRRPAILKNGMATLLPGMLPEIRDPDVLSASDDFSHIVGTGGRDYPEHDLFNLIGVWQWSSEHGQADLPGDLTGDPALPPGSLNISLVSNDGRRAIGNHYFFNREIGDGPLAGYLEINGNPTVYWKDGELRQRLARGANGEYLGQAVACDADCDIVFGNMTWRDMEMRWIPVFGEELPVLVGESSHSWFWEPDTGRSGSLGALNATDDNPKGWNYSLRDASNDGAIAVGAYSAPGMAMGTFDGLIWTKDTGFVQLSALLAENGLSLDWPSMGATDISANGEYILLATGQRFTAPGQIGVPSFSRMALLRLTPKAP